MNLLYKMAAALLIAAVIVILTTPLVKRLAVRFGVVRVPRERDMHKIVMPLWGGLSMFIGFIITVLLLRPFNGQAFAIAEHGYIADTSARHPILGILLGGALVAGVGLLDDKYDLKPWQQTLSLLAGGLIAALFGARIEGITNPFTPTPVSGGYNPGSYIPLGVYSIPVTMVWVFVVAKTFDFLDGLDGLAAGVCAISATTMGLIAAFHTPHEPAVALLAAALAGSCLGFLRHNYNPASIIMGTTGAFFLGFVLATLAVVGSVKGPAALSVAIPLLVLGVPVFDGLYVIGRRIINKQKPTAADRTHIHHRLKNKGWSTKQVVWAIYGLTACGCIVALVLAWNWAR